jgi:hypothetical protein
MTELVSIINLKATVTILIVLVSISCNFSLYVNVVYAMPNHITGNITTQIPTKINETTSDTPSVLTLSPVPLNSVNGKQNSVPLPSASEPTTNNENVARHDGSNSGTHHTQHSTSVDSGSKNNHHSTESPQKIINKVKQKVKVGDIPFP